MFQRTKIAIAIASTITLTACGGGGGGGTKPSEDISWGNGIYDPWTYSSEIDTTVNDTPTQDCKDVTYTRDVWLEKYVNGQPTGIKGDFIRTESKTEEECTIIEADNPVANETTTSSETITISGTPSSVISTTEETRTSLDENGNTLTKVWKIYTKVTTIPITTTVTTTTTRITTYADGTTSSEVIDTTTTSTTKDEVTTSINETLLSSSTSPNIVSTSDVETSEDVVTNGTPSTSTTSVTDTRTSTDSNGSTVTEVWTVYTDTITTPITTTTTVTTTRTTSWTDGSTTSEIVEVNSSDVITQNVSTATREEMVSQTITPNVVGFTDTNSTSSTTTISDPVFSHTIENTDTREDGVWTFYYDVWVTTTTITTTVTTTRTTTYTDGSTTTEVIDTQVTEEVTTDEQVTTRVVPPESTPDAPEAPPSNGSGTVTQPNAPTLDFDPNTYDYSTYYNSPHIGTPTTVDSHDPADFATVEADNGSVIDVNANYAYARGWTGKGSTILVMDTGIDQDHEAFTNKIKYLWDAGYNTPYEDENGHGSHVAGIAAGNKDGLGSHGIAYDADIAVAKIGEQYGISLTGARQALDWAKQYEDIVVANLSANTKYSNDYNNSMTDHGNGVYTNDHIYYGGTNYYNQENPQDWGNVLPSELVLTVSAGNYDLGYVQNPATFASAVDANGNLIMDGRMLVVGNWNTSSQAIDGAKSGHVCKNYTTQCNDPYTTSDFYILAPGTSINSVQNGGGYTNMSGTSMAAPAVAGGVAIIHQLWPYMQGENIAQVLLQTANKSINNYNVTTHGQGLMDLDQATRPIGNLGISLTGRTGATTSVSGGISFDGIDTSAISSVSAIDDFDRDFNIDLSSLVVDNNNSIKSHTMGESWGTKTANLTATEYENYTMAMNDENNYSVGYNYNWYNDIDVNISYTETENSPWIQMSGIWGETNGSSIVDTNVVWRKDQFWTQLGIMNTNTQYESGLVNDIDTIHSAYTIAGWDEDGFGVYGGIKPTAFSGKVNMNVPTSVDNTGVMHYTNTDTNVNNNVEVFAGVDWKYTHNDTTVNISSVADENDYNVGFNLTYKFK